MSGFAAEVFRGELAERVGVGETRCGGDVDDCEGDRDGASDMLATGLTGLVQLIDCST
jgi:hypothetical protein